MIWLCAKESNNTLVIESGLIQVKRMKKSKGIPKITLVKVKIRHINSMFRIYSGPQNFETKVWLLLLLL
jgi:hypothetical protein